MAAPVVISESKAEAAALRRANVRVRGAAAGRQAEREAERYTRN